MVCNLVTSPTTTGGKGTVRVRASLRLKVLLWTVLLLASLAATLGYVFVRIDRTSRAMNLREKVAAHTHLVASHCARTMIQDSGDPQRLQRELQHSTEPREVICTAVLDLEGRLVAFHEAGGTDHQGMLSQILQMAKQPPSFDQWEVELESGVTVLRQPLTGRSAQSDGTRKVGELLLAYDDHTLDQEAAEIRQRIWLTTAGLGPIFALLAWLFSHYLMRPVQRIIEATVEIAEERFERPLRVASRDELAVLAESINLMAEKIRRSRSRAANYNVRLQHMVEERTTELKQALGELEAVDRMKDSFLSSISHEFRTPITSIRAFAEILQQEAELSAENRREFLDIVLQESERLSQLVEKILAATQLSAGTMPMSLAPCSPKELVQSACGNVREAWRQKPSTISYDFADDLPAHVVWDSTLMGRVFHEVMGNSLQFAVGSATVDVSAQRADDRVVMTFRDHGPGISESELASVFESFRQGGNTLTAKPDGTGLGLPLCRMIVEQHEGTIVARRPEQGAGVCIVIDLPICPSHADTNAQLPECSTVDAVITESSPLAVSDV